MTTVYQSHFGNLVVTAPCRGATVSLNDRRYEAPAGFARFVLEALEPARDLTNAQVAALSRTPGGRLR